MQISRDSWHYRIVAKQYWRERFIPTNLCPYMRALLKGMVKTALKYIALTLLCIAVGLLALAPLVWAANVFFDFLPASWLVNDQNNIALFMILAIFGMVLYVACGAGIATAAVLKKYHDFKSARRFMREVEPLTPREPGIFATWWKDFHDKTCTSIEFVETTKDA